MFEMLQPIDSSVLLWIQDYLRNDTLNAVMVPFTRLGDGGLIFIILAVLALLYAKTRKAGAASAIALVFSLIFVTFIMKPIFARPRPYVLIEELTALVTMPNDPYSFPSGHTSAGFALATAFIKTMPFKWIRVLAFILAAFMGFSRIYVAVHNPSDVIAGALVGIISGMLALCVIKVWENRKMTGDGKGEK